MPLPRFDVRLETNNLAYDVDNDGRFLITASVEQSATVPMAVVLNWRREEEITPKSGRRSDLVSGGGFLDNGWMVGYSSPKAGDSAETPPARDTPIWDKAVLDGKDSFRYRELSGHRTLRACRNTTRRSPYDTPNKHRITH